MCQTPHRVAPGGFSDCTDMADRFINGQAVVVNLEDLEPKTRRRIVDFSKGLTCARGGELIRLTPYFYLLLPQGEEFDPSWDPDSTPLAAAGALPVEDWVLTDAVSSKKVG
ncbi:MAG: hypothetical protein CL406_01025 [Acidimicrobiaceae bacterium]|nr:hypothetical protein [Acidimicrobiaceae bacterium]MBP34033.1 hypothetical protein [Roseibacillus sp.]